jgi:hypothetical protein
VDRLRYGEYFGLLAKNDEVVGSLIDWTEMRDGLMSDLRTGYMMDPSSSVSSPDGIGMSAGVKSPCPMIFAPHSSKFVQPSVYIKILNSMENRKKRRL